MSENINELYNKLDFIVSGGALKSLTDFLNEQNIKALVVEKNAANSFNVIDAAGLVPDSLTLNDDVSKYFSSSVVKEFFEIESSCEVPTWPEVIRIRGSQWEIYILFKSRIENGEKFIGELKPYAGLIRLWKNFSTISETEKKLSRLSYMILATKSTLASIFEPMPLKYFASFLTDVLQESLFPKSVAIFKDNGAELELISGKSSVIPQRKGIYADKILPPTPVITKNEKTFEVVLPVAEGSLRLFCLLQWENFPDEQTMNFLELLGSLAVRAVAIDSLKQQSQEIEAKMTVRDFTVMSLSNVLKILRGAQSKEQLISVLGNILEEQDQVDASLTPLIAQFADYEFKRFE